MTEQHPEYGPWFVARYDGECDGCGEEILAEVSEIRSDGEGGWLCEVCGFTDDDDK